MPSTGQHKNNRIKARGRHALRLTGFMMLSVMLLPSSGHAQDDATRARLDQMQNDIDTLNHAVYRGEPPPADASTPPSGDASTAATASLDIRLSQLESQMTTLTGHLEETQHQIQTLQQQYDQTLSKLDARLTALEQRPAAPPAPVTAPTDPDVAADAGAVDSSSTGNLTSADTATLDAGTDFTGGTASGSSAPHATTPVFTSSGGKVSTPVLGTLTQPASGGPASAKSQANSPDKAYEDAYAMLKAQKYPEAQQAFAAFLAKYPKHPLAANAQFWLGETYFDRTQYDKAAKAFAVAYQNYPQGPKGPDALLKLGMSLNGLGKHNEACLTYAQLKKQYPSAVPVLARAGQEADKISCKS